MEPPNQDLPVVRQWPPDEPLDPQNCCLVQCAACGAPWRVHVDLAGFRMRCSCTAWIAIPPRSAAVSVFPFDGGGTAGPPAPLAKDADGLLMVPVARGQVTDQEMPVHLPMAPGTVLHGNTRTQQRWTNAAFLELGMLMGAFLLPHLGVELCLQGEARMLVLPFVSMATGVVVVLIAAVTNPYAFRGFTGAAPRHFLEACLTAVVMAGLALLWMGLVDRDDESGAMMRGVRSGLGVGWGLFVVAFCPAVFEELAFRGAIQGRFLAILGRSQGLVATGACFGLCHGVTAALPFHVGLGIYLGWLRDRASSLVPGIVLHALYNGTILLAS